MIYRAMYCTRAGTALREVVFEAEDLHEAIRIVGTTQEVPVDAIEVMIEPVASSDA